MMLIKPGLRGHMLSKITQKHAQGASPMAESCHANAKTRSVYQSLSKKALVTGLGLP